MGKKKEIRHVQVNGNEYYVYDLDPDINRKRIRLYGKSKEEVEKKIAMEMERRKMETEQRKKILSKKIKSFSELANSYIDSIKGTHPVKKIDRYQTFIQHRFTDTLKNAEIEIVSTKEINEELKIISETMSPDLFDELYRFVVDCIKFAHSFRRMPCVKEDLLYIPEMPENDSENNYEVTEKDYNLIKEECLKKQTTAATAILFIMELGLRASEIETLTWGDISDDFKTLYLTRRKKIIQISLDEDLYFLICKMRDKYEILMDDEETILYDIRPEMPLFQNRNEDVLDKSSLRSYLQTMCTNCGASNLITLNALREYCGKRMLIEGKNIKEVQKKLGFDSAGYTSKLYSDFLYEQVLVEVLDRTETEENQKKQILAYFKELIKKID